MISMTQVMGLNSGLWWCQTAYLMSQQLKAFKPFASTETGAVLSSIKLPHHPGGGSQVCGI